jgi:hypothetical protein
VLLFCSVIYKDNEMREKAVVALQQQFGKNSFCSEPMAFDFTDYYEKELGSDLVRIIMAFDELISRDCLPEIKHKTNQIEAKFEDNGKRRVNLDPGILSLENICLATTKAYSHRIYLSNGIWGDLTLIYKGNAYSPLPWTYPDYQSEGMKEIFNHLRQIYKEKIQC